MEKNKKRKNKRANGEGCIRQLPDGRWEARITDGYQANGKQHFKTFSSKKQSVVIEKLNKFKENKKMFNSDTAVKYKMREWLEIWYDTYVKSNVRVSTRISYEGIIKNHLIPNIGYINLIDLKKFDIEKMYNKLLINGRKDNKVNKNGGLSLKSIKNIHLVLHKALQEAVEREYIEKNPASIAKVPTMKCLNIKKDEIEIYTKDEQIKLIDIAKEDKIYGTIVIFALYTGMRKGEILGLQWNDVDFENKTININKQLNRLKDYENYGEKRTTLRLQYNTKTNNSTRKIPMSDTLINILKEHYELQKEYKKLLGRTFLNYNMVFSKENGDYLDPTTVYTKYKQLAQKAKIKQCTFHALRHTFATRALESGISPKVVSNILGHSSVQFTLDTYTHVLSELKLYEINKLDRYINSIAI